MVLMAVIYETFNDKACFYSSVPIPTAALQSSKSGGSNDIKFKNYM